jgi:competence protein ComEC
MLIADTDAPPTHSVTVMDVGQGLSVVIHAEDRALVYDTGQGRPGGFSQAEKVLLPYLGQRGLNKIDVLLISHGDQDHSGGLDFLNGQINIGRRLGFGGEPCRNGERWRWGAIEFLVINGPGQGDEVRNDHSCGLLVRAPGFSVLIPGDVSERKEREWVRYWRDELRATVLVLGHHGSQTSTGHAFLKWVEPRAALASTGRGNPFGHPHRAVLHRLTEAGVDHRLDTARDGAILISFTDQRGPTLRGRRSQWSPYWLKLP